MPKFLWSGKAASGQEEVEEVEAETAIAARKILEARGWTDLRQHTSEVHDFAVRQIRESIPRNDPKLTPKERLQYHEGTAPGFWSNWLKSVGGSAGVILLLAVFVLLTTYDRGKPGNNIKIGIFVFLLAIIVFLFPAVFWWSRRTKRLFVKLHTARTWRRWNEVVRCLDKLPAAQRATKSGIGDFEMARYRALALAGKGRLDEALASYRAAAEKANPPPWLIHSFEAGLYIVAKQYDQALAYYRLALDKAVDKSIVCLDLGMYLVQRYNCPDEAKKLLAQAEACQLSELALVHVPYLRGAIAFRERDYAAMDQNMREALAGFEKRAAVRFYIFEASLLTCKGYLAVSGAALGRKDEARRYFAQAKDYLALIGLDDLVAQYETILGRA